MTVRVVNDNPYGTLSEERLDEFEKSYSIALPEDYRKFLRQHNGGKPIPSFFWIKPQEDGTNVFQFYGLHDGPKSYSIHTFAEEKLGVPDLMLRIGDDGTDNFICIDVSLGGKGGTFFVDHEVHPFHDSKSMVGVTKVANSFSEFLFSLSENPD